MSKIEVKITTSEYFIKKAKPISSASQIYLNKKFINETMNLIKLPSNESDYTIKEIDKKYEIKLNTDLILKKEAKARGHGAYCYLPLELAGENILVFKA